jgi:hypothetical protein
MRACIINLDQTYYFINDKQLENATEIVHIHIIMLMFVSTKN